MELQLSLFGDEGVAGMPKTTHPTPPTPTDTEQQPKPEAETKSHDQLEREKLLSLNLRYGMTSVYYVKGKIVGYGDVNHCPREDIEHNLSVLAGYLAKTGAKRGGLGKAYDEDVYALGIVDRSSLPEPENWIRFDLDIEQEELHRRTMYKEPLYRLIETERGFTPRLIAKTDEEYKLT